MTEDLIELDCDVEGWLKLNSFSGGLERGRCIQLTTPLPNGYVQMTYNQARRFFRQAIKEINKIEKRYNENPPWWEEIQNSLRPKENQEEEKNV